MDYKKTVVQDAESAETYYFEDDAKRILDILNEFQERLPSLQQGRNTAHKWRRNLQSMLAFSYFV